MESDRSEVTGESGVHWSTKRSRMRSKMMESDRSEVRGESGVDWSTKRSRIRSKTMEFDGSKVRGESGVDWSIKLITTAIWAAITALDRKISHGIVSLLAAKLSP